MPTLFKADGTSQEIFPKKDKFELEELQTLVGGYIELCPTINDQETLVVDEEGALKSKPFNKKATALYKHKSFNFIVGDAVLVKTSDLL
jgi:hypothetical protein